MLRAACGVACGVTCGVWYAAARRQFLAISAASSLRGRVRAHGKALVMYTVDIALASAASPPPMGLSTSCRSCWRAERHVLKQEHWPLA